MFPLKVLSWVDICVDDGSLTQVFEYEKAVYTSDDDDDGSDAVGDEEDDGTYLQLFSKPHACTHANCSQAAQRSLQPLCPTKLTVFVHGLPLPSLLQHFEPKNRWAVNSGTFELWCACQTQTEQTECPEHELAR